MTAVSVLQAELPTSTSRPRSSLASWALVVLILGACQCFIAPVPWLSPILGLLLITVIPTVMLRAKLRIPGSSNDVRTVLSAAVSVFLVLLVGLSINTVLPVLGDPHPLARLPVVVSLTMLTLVLVIWRRQSNPRFPVQVPITWPRELAAVVTLLGLSALGVVAGANRLNNGSSGWVSVLAFALILGTLCLTWHWRVVLGSDRLCTILYGATFLFLLGTSLRGWYITGHDVQREYHVFQFTSQASHWNISAFPDPYNACLSITILPTMWSRVLGVSDPYLFKVVVQGVFALTPVCVFLIGRRVFGQGVGFLAALLFLGFPTFFTDMPFITRQEVGFSFLAVAFLMATDDRLSLQSRRFWFCIMAIAVVLSHYSTTYLLIIALIVAQVLWRSFDLGSWISRRGKPTQVVVRPPKGRPVAGVTVTLFIGVMAFLWTVPATHTSSQLRLTIDGTVATLLGRQPASSSTDLSYSLLHQKVLTPNQELAAYRAETLKQKFRDGSDYLPASTVKRYQVEALSAKDLPLTGVGRALQDNGVSPKGFNSVIRRGLADYYQLAAVAGLLLVGWRLRRNRMAVSHREYVFLAVGAFGAIAAVVILPDLSAEYGPLRAFQQSLILLAPLAAEFTVAVVRLASRKRSESLAIGFGVFACLSLTGILPQLVGGYPPQLSLNNSGTYYQDYYLQPEEETAISWLDHQLSAGSPVQAEVETDRYTFYLVGHRGVVSTNDIFPTIIRRNAYVFIGSSTVTSDEASISYAGNTISYRYPLGLLDSQKALVFSSPESRVYK